MPDDDGPRVLLLARHHLYALQIAAELTVDLDATVIGVTDAPASPIAASRYADETKRVSSGTPAAFGEAALDVAVEEDVDIVVPVGQLSVRSLDAVRDSVPPDVACPLPPADALATALNKRSTAELAADLGIDTPDVLARLDPSLSAREATDPGDVSYPVFLKAEREAGRNLVARVDSPSAFVEEYERLRTAGEDTGHVLVQEVVGDGRTFGCGLLFAHGAPRLSVVQEELRSIPREGGTGTRVRIRPEPDLVRQSAELLAELSWRGPALVEYTRRPDGTYCLMEINPKFWASYPLASRNGYRVATELVAAELDRPRPQRPTPDESGEMVFPLRELYHVLGEPDESLLAAARAMFWPPAPVDVRLRDARAWLAPGGIGTSARWAVDRLTGADEPF